MDIKENIAECAIWLMGHRARIDTDIFNRLSRGMINNKVSQPRLLDEEFVPTASQIRFIIVCRMAMVAEKFLSEKHTLIKLDYDGRTSVALPPIKFGTKTSRKAALSLRSGTRGVRLWDDGPLLSNTGTKFGRDDVFVMFELRDTSSVNPHASGHSNGSMCISRTTYKALNKLLVAQQWEEFYMSAIAAAATYNPGSEYTLVGKSLLCHVTNHHGDKSVMSECYRCKRWVRRGVLGVNCPECYSKSCQSKYHDSCKFVNMPLQFLPEYQKFCATCSPYSLKLLSAEDKARMKPCSNSTCNNSKMSIPLTQFRRDASAIDGHKSRCKECCDE